MCRMILSKCKSIKRKAGMLTCAGAVDDAPWSTGHGRTFKLRSAMTMTIVGPDGLCATANLNHLTRLCRPKLPTAEELRHQARIRTHFRAAMAVSKHKWPQTCIPRVLSHRSKIKEYPSIMRCTREVQLAKLVVASESHQVRTKYVMRQPKWTRASPINRSIIQKLKKGLEMSIVCMGLWFIHITYKLRRLIICVLLSVLHIQIHVYVYTYCPCVSSLKYHMRAFIHCHQKQTSIRYRLSLRSFIACIPSKSVFCYIRFP